MLDETSGRTPLRPVAFDRGDNFVIGSGSAMLLEARRASGHLERPLPIDRMPSGDTQHRLSERTDNKAAGDEVTPSCLSQWRFAAAPDRRRLDAYCVLYLSLET